jgi:hypothetical protein
MSVHFLVFGVSANKKHQPVDVLHHPVPTNLTIRHGKVSLRSVRPFASSSLMAQVNSESTAHFTDCAPVLLAGTPKIIQNLLLNLPRYYGFFEILYFGG